jgi:hypothetical protein
MHKNREISCTSWSQDQDRSAKAKKRALSIYVLWRAITASQLAGADGNPDTPDPSWNSLIMASHFAHHGVRRNGRSVLLRASGLPR